MKKKNNLTNYAKTGHTSTVWVSTSCEVLGEEEKRLYVTVTEETSPGISKAPRTFVAFRDALMTTSKSTPGRSVDTLSTRRRRVVKVSPFGDSAKYTTMAKSTLGCIQSTRAMVPASD